MTVPLGFAAEDAASCVAEAAESVLLNACESPGKSGELAEASAVALYVVGLMDAITLR